MHEYIGPFWINILVLAFVEFFFFSDRLMLTIFVMCICSYHPFEALCKTIQHCVAHLNLFYYHRSLFFSRLVSDRASVRYCLVITFFIGYISFYSLRPQRV